MGDDAFLVLDGHYMCIYDPDKGISSPPLRKINLVGTHLVAGKPKEFVLTPGQGPPTTVSVPTAEEKDSWIVALGRVPGLFRRVCDYYKVGDHWGEGATSTVYECQSLYEPGKFAYKTRRQKKSVEASKAMHNELRILQICAKDPHPAIPSLHDYFFDSKDGSIELIMELMEGGELYDWIVEKGKLTEIDAKVIFKQVVEGVAHLHSLGIVHRDLKPSNLMYVEKFQHDAAGTGTGSNHHQVKIMDYDLAKVDYSPEWGGSTPCGTSYYMAPEMCLRRKYGQSVDIWSLGVVLYIFLCGQVPFGGATSDSVHRAAVEGRFTMEGTVWKDVSEDAKDLIHTMLRVDPAARPTAAEVLKHPWMVKADTVSHTPELPTPSTMKQILSQSKKGAKHRMDFDLKPIREAAEEAAQVEDGSIGKASKYAEVVDAKELVAIQNVRLQLEAAGTLEEHGGRGGSPVASSSGIDAEGLFADIGAAEVDEEHAV